MFDCRRRTLEAWQRSRVSALALQCSADSISRRISSTRHTVMRCPSLTGLGNRPDLTPSHHVDLLTGMGFPGPIMRDKRRKPVRGILSCCDTPRLRPLTMDGVLHVSTMAVTEFSYGLIEFGMRQTEFSFGWSPNARSRVRQYRSGGTRAPVPGTSAQYPHQVSIPTNSNPKQSSPVRRSWLPMDCIYSPLWPFL